LFILTKTKKSIIVHYLTRQDTVSDVHLFLSEKQLITVC